MKKQLDKSYHKLTEIFSRELLEATLPSIVLILVVLVIGYKFIDPAPPRKIVISTGSPVGNYRAFASIYGVYLKKEGITLELRESSGDVENLKRLKDDGSGVDMAFIQDGIASSEGAGTLVSLGSLYYEPAWILCRCKKEITHLSELKGKKIAIGIEGEGTRVLALALLGASGINTENASLVSIGGEQAAIAILKGDVDAAIFVDVPDSPIIAEILKDPSIQLVGLNDAEAFTRQFSYLHHLTLPQGALNLGRNLPSHDVDLLAPTATLVIKENMHPALVYLMLKVISQVHSGPGMLHKKGDFPSEKDTDFPVSSQAVNFYKSGPPFLDKYLPFWAATFVSRTLIFILPLLALLIPLTRIIPTAYIWLVKMKLFRYYGELRFLETQLNEGGDRENNKQYLEKLNEIEDRVREMKLPVTFSQYVYDLRSHINLVRSRLERAETPPNG
jgi:TRAP transporter TAXI family solute receptor